MPKYPADCNQILTEIFDYIRCTDICDPSLYSPGAQYTYAVSLSSNTATNGNSTYPITPIQISGREVKPRWDLAPCQSLTRSLFV